jgi:ribosomal protein S18 acetylase RimI-like enzyme
VTARARRATVDDVDEIARVCSEGWRETYRELYSSEEVERIIEEFYNPARLRSEVENPQGWDGWWVSEDDDGKILAAGGGGLIAPGVGEVFVLYADPARRGEGGGSAVLAAMTREQREQGAAEQWVSVEPENEKGMGFYGRHGFEPGGTRPAYRREGVALRLRRRLHAS